MKVADIIKLCEPKTCVSIEQPHVRHYCLNADENCGANRDCDNCEDDSTETKIELCSCWAGRADEVPIKLGDERITEIHIDEEAPRSGRKGKKWLESFLVLVIPEADE